MQVTPKADLPGLVGTETGVSDWITIEQDRVNQFADVTEDHQFIHVNPEMAAKTPFGGPIAHGFLTLSLLSKMAEGPSVVVEGVQMGINYGFDKVRFINPVPVGSRVRGRFIVASIDEKSPGQYLIKYNVTVEIDGIDKPALVAEWMAMQVAP